MEQNTDIKSAKANARHSARMIAFAKARKVFDEVVKEALPDCIEEVKGERREEWAESLARLPPSDHKSFKQGNEECAATEGLNYAINIADVAAAEYYEKEYARLYKVCLEEELTGEEAPHHVYWR